MSNSELASGVLTYVGLTSLEAAGMSARNFENETPAPQILAKFTSSFAPQKSKSVPKGDLRADIALSKLCIFR